MCVRVCLCMHVCLAVMTLCLWAPTEYVYLPQQHRAKIDDASLTRTRTHTHTPCAVSLFPLLCSNCLPPAFSISHTLPCSSPYYLLQSHTLFSSYFTPFSIFPPTCVAICLLMMQLEHQCQLPASDGERERSVVVVYMPCFVPLPLISPPLCLCCFPQSWPMRAACGLSAAVSFREEPNM